MSATSQNTTPPRNIPGEAGLNPKQATENESGCLSFSVRENEGLCPVLYQSGSIPASLMSATSVVFHDDRHHANEDAMQYPKDCAQPRSLGGAQRDGKLGAENGEALHQQLNEAEENLTVPQQAIETDSDKKTMEMVITDDYCSKSLIDGYLNIKMVTEIMDREPRAGNLANPQGAAGPRETTSSVAATEEPLTMFQMDEDDDLHIEREDRARDLPPDIEDMPHSLQAENEEIGCSETAEDKRSGTDDLVDHVVHSKIENDSHNSSRSRSSSDSSDASSGSDKSSRKEVDITIKRDKLCSSISACSSQTEYKSSKFTIAGIKGTCTFHAQGLDEDFDNRHGTVTAVFDFPKNPKSDSVLNQQDCRFKLSVSVYEGPVERNILLGSSSSCRKPTDEDIRQNRKMHMTVHRVVNLSDIIFSKVNPSKITVNIVVEVS